jgi:hypothetical protein
MKIFHDKQTKHRASLSGWKRLVAIPVFLTMSALLPNPANAMAITGAGGQIFGTGGNIVVDILPSSSGYTNDINLYFAYPDLSMATFIGIDNNSASVDLGLFALGAELVFGIVNDPGDIFVMGDATRNPDNLIHANVFNDAIGAGFVESWIVGFEDLYDGGDNDFNDAFIRVNLAAAVPEPRVNLAPAIPEPSVIALFAAGLLGLGFARRKMRS